MGAEIENPADDFEITGFSTLEQAKAGEISFVSSEKYLEHSAASKASALILPEKLAAKGTQPAIRLREPWAGVLYLLNHLHPDNENVYYSGVHRSAVVDPTAKLAANVSIGPLVVIGPLAEVGDGSVIGPRSVIGPKARIGAHCLLHPGVVIEHEVQIGNRVIIQSGAVIGGDGFKYEVIGGKWQRIPQVGRVVIEDDVEIGANTCIDRASFTETRIGANTKIDNLVQIAHNVQIGSNCIVVSQSGIAGSSSMGDWTILAAGAGVADNVKLGKKVRVIARSGVKDDIPDGETWGGYPATPFRQFAKMTAASKHLPELVSEVAKLKATVEALQKKLGE